MIGEVLDGYELTRKLGQGDTGETYLAVQRDSGHRAAAKLLLPQFCSDRALVDQLFAEVKTANLVGHPGIAGLHGCGVHGSGRAFLLMEYLEGKTLTDALIELGSVSDVESFADIAWQLATLLGAAHTGQLVHGALKPDAIFLTFPEEQAPKPRVKLLDFGMSRFALDVRHSQTGSLLGAPLYMSPEMGRGLGKVDHRADIYSLGCILFEMACGRPPFVREGKGELVIAHATEAPPVASSLEPSLPLPIDTLIGRMLTKNPAARPQSMAEVAGILEKFFSLPPPAQPILPAVPVCPPGPAVALASASIAAPILEPSPAPPANPPPPPRKQEPTALLPPAPQVWPSQRAPAGARALASQPWAARVHQRTLVLDPVHGSKPSASSAAPGLPRNSRQAHSPTAADAHSSPISLPVVVLSASLVLATGATALLLRGRKPAMPPAPTAPVATPVPSRPPTSLGLAETLPLAPPAALPAKPKPLPAASARPSTKAAPPRAPAVPPEPRSVARGEDQATGKPEPTRKKPAPLW